MKRFQYIRKRIISLALILAMAVGMFASLGLGGKAKAKSYTLTLNANGGTLVKAGVTYPQNGKQFQMGFYANNAFQLPTEVPQRSGYYFAGWGESPNTTIVKYYAGQWITLYNTQWTSLPDNTTLYAVWIRSNGVYRVTFDGNGGYWADPYNKKNIKTIDKFIAGGQNISGPTFLRDGYDFAGWRTSKGGFEAGKSTFRVTNHMTLYAVWKTHVYFHGSTGYNDQLPYSTSVIVGTPLKYCDFYKLLPAGYHFADKNGKTVSIDKTITEDTHLYLVANTATITLKGPGWTKSFTIKTDENIAQKLNELKFSPDNKGHAILGWKCDNVCYSPTAGIICAKDGEKKTYTAITIYDKSQTRTIEKIYMHKWEIYYAWDNMLAYQKNINKLNEWKDIRDAVGTSVGLFCGALGCFPGIGTAAAVTLALCGATPTLLSTFLPDSYKKDSKGVVVLCTKLESLYSTAAGMEEYQRVPVHVEYGYSDGKPYLKNIYYNAQ
ncbi:MAG: InlB B-repeat-containing protein [Lachnospiraceae bacterium]|nr:InlB B-repeat-containing protein [Lachnospiraceae bacterium]